jgi:hypothetical protein
MQKLSWSWEETGSEGMVSEKVQATIMPAATDLRHFAYSLSFKQAAVSLSLYHTRSAQATLPNIHPQTNAFSWPLPSPGAFPGAPFG